jgi:predicted nucleic acid-binding protein
MKAVLDTRFFTYSLLSVDEAIKKKARTTLQELQRGKNRGIVPSIVLHELYKFDLQTLGKDVAETTVNSILRSDLQVVDLNPPIAIEAAKLRCKYAELPTADAIIAATAIEKSADYVVTDDNHFKQIREVNNRWL